MTPRYLRRLWWPIYGCYWCGGKVPQWHRHNGWLVAEVENAINDTYVLVRKGSPTMEDLQAVYALNVRMVAVALNLNLRSAERGELIAHTLGHIQGFDCNRVTDDITMQQVLLTEKMLADGVGVSGL